MKEKEQVLTGYPSIDKPWMKYYRKTPIKEIAVNQTIYEMVFNSNKDNMNDAALEYMGAEYTYQQLKDMTDHAAGVLHSLGLRKHDVVLIGTMNCVEAVVALLAINKLGAVSKWFDVRAGEKSIEDYANSSNCKYLVVLNMILPKVQTIIDNTKIEKIFIIEPETFLNMDACSSCQHESETIDNALEDIRYSKFIELLTTNNYTDVSVEPFEKDRPSIMVQSSGTTGKPKTIVHSDFSCTSCVSKIAYSDLPFGKGKVSLAILPPCIAYGLGNSILLPITLGTKVILSPTFELDVLLKYVGKFSIALAGPMYCRHLLDKIHLLDKNQREALAKAECMLSGGDKISVEENSAFEEIFQCKVLNGYGSNECWGALTVNPIKCNKYGSAGIPKYGETVISYDNESGKELEYGETGEICALTDTKFLYYEGNTEETEKIKKVHDDGKIWIHTGDIGFIDEDGYVWLGGRTRRVIIRNAFKISAYDIEDKICEHSAVKECVAVEVENADEGHVPMAYIVLRDEYKGRLESVKNEISEKCRNELKEYEIPVYFRYVDSLPYTANGKYDFRLLEKQGNEFVAMT